MTVRCGEWAKGKSEPSEYSCFCAVDFGVESSSCYVTQPIWICESKFDSSILQRNHSVPKCNIHDRGSEVDEDTEFGDGTYQEMCSHMFSYYPGKYPLSFKDGFLEGNWSTGFFVCVPIGSGDV